MKSSVATAAATGTDGFSKQDTGEPAENFLLSELENKLDTLVRTFDDNTKHRKKNDLIVSGKVE